MQSKKNLKPLLYILILAIVSLITSCSTLNNNDENTTVELYVEPYVEPYIIIPLKHTVISSITPELIMQSMKIEEELNANAATLATTTQSWFKVIQGNIPVIITVPHSTNSVREGKVKISDGGATAALAIDIHNLTGAWVIYTQYAAPSDPSYYDDNPFKHRLSQIIKQLKPQLLLDIHASNSYQAYDIDFSTMKGKSLWGNKINFLTNLVSSLRLVGIANLSTDLHNELQDASMIQFSVDQDVPAMKLTIHPTWLMPSRGALAAHRYAKILQAISHFIQTTHAHHYSNMLPLKPKVAFPAYDMPFSLTQ